MPPRSHQRERMIAKLERLRGEALAEAANYEKAIAALEGRRFRSTVDPERRRQLEELGDFTASDMAPALGVSETRARQLVRELSRRGDIVQVDWRNTGANPAAVWRWVPGGETTE